MKKFEYNDRVGMFEIDPNHISEGLLRAREKGYEEIRIRSQNMDYGSKFVIDFDVLTRNPFITKLDFADNVGIKSGQTALISRLVNLKHLAFENPSFKIDFKHVPQLEELIIKYHKGVKNVDSLFNLKKLQVRFYDGKDCAMFGKLAGLEQLKMVKGKLVSLKGVERLKKLEVLSLNYLSRLEDAYAVARLGHLRKLHVEKCKRLRNFSFLEGNLSIQELFVSELNSVAFVGSMSNLRKFGFWNTEDGDLSPILRASGLKDVHFYPDKKHYSHKKQELLELLGR